MGKTDYEVLCADARVFAQLDEEKVRRLHSIAADIRPGLPGVTEKFFQHLLLIPRLEPFLDGRIDSLKQSHQKWLQALFQASFDAEYTEDMYSFGDVHGKIQLPAEFMTGAMSIVQGHLIGLLRKAYADQPEKLLESLLAINAAIGFSLYVMQAAYQSSAVANELERFLAITGMSHNLFENLAKAYR